MIRAVRTARRLLGTSQRVLVRMESAFYGRGPVRAALTGGAAVSVTVRMDPAVKKAIATIRQDAWMAIEYTDAIFDEATGSSIEAKEALIGASLTAVSDVIRCHPVFTYPGSSRRRTSSPGYTSFTTGAKND